jgi:hypothetical protein
VGRWPYSVPLKTGRRWCGLQVTKASGRLMATRLMLRCCNSLAEERSRRRSGSYEGPIHFQEVVFNPRANASVSAVVAHRRGDRWQLRHSMSDGSLTRLHRRHVAVASHLCPVAGASQPRQLHLRRAAEVVAPPKISVVPEINPRRTPGCAILRSEA